ncbi:hypothetical protein [Paenibacillus sp. ACRRY]|uniref:hypothetical protein n=1 Tax=Paenibacillus sp. ACRRY TaxID=2918208 RepID=UPI001EF584B9|nr:hypothetical protein [Paenibacillus sp. ACRRY]MCG7385087.1 hypothetical protein [Paenibacillus sp. ACRRY]
MKLNLNGLERAVQTLFFEYKDQASLGLVVDKIIDDYDELITLSRACELVIYRTLSELVTKRTGFVSQRSEIEELLELLGDINEAIITIRNELDYDDNIALQSGEVNIGSNFEGITKQFAY